MTEEMVMCDICRKWLPRRLAYIELALGLLLGSCGHRFFCEDCRQAAVERDLEYEAE
jgi:hypothetical protein